MSSIDNLAKDLYTIIHNREEKGPKPYEPVGKVVKIDETDSNIVWVKIPGGDSETPVEKTVNAKVGDRVRLRLSGGRGWVLGNATSPPTDDTVAYNAQSIAITASGIAQDANDAANLAIEKVDQSVIDMAEQVIRIDGDISSLQDQIDGNITTWFYDYEPTDENYPANEWILEGQENEHLGDLFYDTTTGYAYRWMSDGDDPPTYSWSRITDTDVTKALADAATAQDTADHKRRVFITQPVPPYDVGDLWFVGTTGDILTCTTSKTEEQSYSSSDWNKLNKYTDDSALNAFLSGSYVTDKLNLQQQIDGKAETWYQTNDPSSAWTTAELRSSHEGDLWYRTTDDTTWYWNGTTWSQQNIPSSVFDEIDGKAQIFTSQPVPPYDVGDLWFNSSSSDIMTCINARSSGNYNANDWQKRNKYTDDSALNTFLSGTYISDKTNLQQQIDGKAETWYQSNDPSTSWTTAELRSSHEGDLWYKTSDKTTWYWNGTSWVQQNVPDEVFDKIDGKAQIFTSQPAPPYNVGDLWFNSATSDIMTCINARSSGNYVASDWQKRNKYTDDQLAQSAWDYADSAHTAATNAWNWADDAHTAATTAWNYANDANNAAITANRAANDALTQLSVVEEVVDTLNWISEHGTYKLSTDTTVNAQKMYFTLTGTAVSISTLGDGTKLTNLESYYEKSGNIYVKTTDTVYNSRKTYYTVSAELVINPTGNPNTNRYYEIYDIDTAVQNYISSHLSLTDSGLYVVKDNQGYKVLLANDGLKIYDNQGHLVSTFGENIIFDSSRPQTIGNSSTYIKWYDSNNDHVADSIEIAGSNVSIASNVTIGGMPTNVSELNNDSGYQTGSEVSGAISTATSGLLSGVTTKDRYYLSTSPSSAMGGSWQDTVPTWSSGKYIWTRVATTKTTSSGTNTTYSTAVYDSALTKALSDANGAASTVTTTKQYYLSTLASSATGGSWSGNVPTWSSGKYIWIRFKIDKTTVGGTTSTSYSPSENGQYDSALTTALSTASSAQNAANGAVASTVSCYYRSTTQSTPSINAATSIGTSANTDNAWEYVMPQPKRGCYFYTCEEYTPVSGTKTYSTVRPLDNATYTSKWCSASDNVYIDGGAIYANSVTADKMAANSITIGNMDANTKDEILNSKGRNILRNTTDYREWAITSTTSDYEPSVTGSLPTNIVTFPDTTSAVIYQYMMNRTRIKYSVMRNKNIIFTADVKATNGVTTGILVGYEIYDEATGGTRKLYTNRKIVVNGTGDWQKCIESFFVEDSVFTQGSGVVDFDTCYIRFILYKTFDEGYTAGFQIKNLKLEVGTTATDWSQAPEDMGTTATSYITTISDTGIEVHPTSSDDYTSYVQITGDGITLYHDDIESVSISSEDITLGNMSGPHVSLDPEGLNFYQDEDTNAVAYINSEKLFINNSEINQTLRLGNYSWIISDERISLVYDPIPVSE